MFVFDFVKFVLNGRRVKSVECKMHLHSCIKSGNEVLLSITMSLDGPVFDSQESRKLCVCVCVCVCVCERSSIHQRMHLCTEWKEATK